MTMFTITYRLHGEVTCFPVYARDKDDAKETMKRIEPEAIIVGVEESKDLV